MLDICVRHEITIAKRQRGFKNSLPTTPPLLSYQTSARRAKVAGKMQKAESFTSRALAAKNARKEKETMRFEQFRSEMVGVLYDVTRRKGEVIKRMQINNWGDNTRQEAPELRLQVTSQKTKVENPSSILYIGAALTENVAVIQVTARKEKERTQVSTTQAQAILKLNEQEQEYRTFITSAI